MRGVLGGWVVFADEPHIIRRRLPAFYSGGGKSGGKHGCVGRRILPGLTPFAAFACGFDCAGGRGGGFFGGAATGGLGGGLLGRFAAGFVAGGGLALLAAFIGGGLAAFGAAFAAFAHIAAAEQDQVDFAGVQIRTRHFYGDRIAHAKAHAAAFAFDGHDFGAVVEVVFAQVADVYHAVDMDAVEGNE